ncbi:D-sedoheptulose-7-phosphate isomerase [Mesoterricola silvestris]|uniref:Phosphoheptose isomerase n=1 Tax=Mesoterricola silvestris TaxID=2927979 RepID=A0AA48GNH2_9BACT|nr:SIS domain-containing protein [Mesoterricola silvestris]BDU71072.1 phosphoheptose isomerase [Mesoterricola silvestris]
MTRINDVFAESAANAEKLRRNVELHSCMGKAVEAMITAFRSGGRVLFCGNGGSAADAQHLAAEFSGRFYFDRPPLDSEALHVNTSFLTAVANDYDYNVTYARLVLAKGRPGDVLVGITTSGNSKNILAAFEKAKEVGMVTVGMTGEGGGKLKGLSDILLEVPSNDTPRIQEGHILIGHILCELVEKGLFA